MSPAAGICTRAASTEAMIPGMLALIPVNRARASPSAGARAMYFVHAAIASSHAASAWPSSISARSRLESACCTYVGMLSRIVSIVTIASSMPSSTGSKRSGSVSNC